jgi:hypothetical protein
VVQLPQLYHLDFRHLADIYATCIYAQNRSQQSRLPDLGRLAQKAALGLLPVPCRAVPSPPLPHPHPPTSLGEGFGMRLR